MLQWWDGEFAVSVQRQVKKRQAAPKARVQDKRQGASGWDLFKRLLSDGVGQILSGKMVSAGLGLGRAGYVC